MAYKWGFLNTYDTWEPILQDLQGNFPRPIQLQRLWQAPIGQDEPPDDVASAGPGTLWTRNWLRIGLKTGSFTYISDQILIFHQPRFP